MACGGSSSSKDEDNEGGRAGWARIVRECAGWACYVCVCVRVYEKKDETRFITPYAYVSTISISPNTGILTPTVTVCPLRSSVAR